MLEPFYVVLSENTFLLIFFFAIIFTDVVGETNFLQKQLTKAAFTCVCLCVSHPVSVAWRSRNGSHACSVECLMATCDDCCITCILNEASSARQITRTHYNRVGRLYQALNTVT